MYNTNSDMTARDKLLERLEQLLVGPGLGVPNETGSHENEIIQGRLGLAYMLGMLYPQKVREDSALGGDEDTAQTDDGDGKLDDPLSMSTALLPASMGISFCLDDGAKFEVVVSAAHYVKNEECENEEWIRRPITPEKYVFSTDKLMKNETIWGGVAELSVLPRQIADRKWLVTTSVSNVVQMEKSNSKNTLFQVKLQVYSKKCKFREYPTGMYEPTSDEDRELYLNYHGTKTYAVGHGVSSDWTLDKKGECISVRTQPIPKSHVRQPVFDRLEVVVGNEKLIFEDTDLFTIADLSTERVVRGPLIERLRSFVAFYEKWIDGQRHIALPDGFVDDSKRILARCKKSADRMYEGVSLLEKNDLVFRTFQLANMSILMSMCHQLRINGLFPDSNQPGPYELGKADTSTLEYLENRNVKWRPFQLAFMLQLIPSLWSEDHIDRDIVDVVWFATGGGKTEAYQFASAFELIRRRLIYGERGNGVGVINRYTYRFLTSDQFVRTAGMICALELLRRKLKEKDDLSLGKSTFSVGLFAGRNVCPNRFNSNDDGAHQLRNQLEDAQRPRSENPFPIESCPSCGTLLVPELARKHHDGTTDRSFYGFNSDSTSFLTSCPDENCEFHNEIPVYFVDEQIYANTPSFLLGTIDKFAMIPWDEKGGRIFGVGTNTKPPTLILQDELHLISGPLGTLAGIYEAAFETLIQSVTVTPPKVIAATATIRNARTQCKRLYGRKGIVFPSPGLKAEDSFFSRVDIENDHRSRLYVGVMGQGMRSTVAVSWTIAAILQSVYELKLDRELSEKELDNYWTLIAYHNSRRELGRISNATRDEIPERVKVYASSEDTERPRFRVMELTAQSDTPIATARNELSARHHDDSPSFDIVPCTSVISVGIDIDRLGLMLVNGQPKLTAEYIQATSRIGRGEVPGVVIACYSPSKSRDRSHYESFRDFHDRFYSYVEPTSVTPGSLPAIERALHAALITVVRHGSSLSKNKDAANFGRDRGETTDLIKKLSSRLKKAYDSTDEVDIRNRIETTLEGLCEQWYDWAATHKDLAYRARPKELSPVLMTRFGDRKYRNLGWHTLQSMRHVDPEITLQVADI